LGRDLRPGDWVRIVQAPLTITGMPAETLRAFSSAIGLTLQILDFDETGCVQLQLAQKLPQWNGIWLEPYCCIRSRRPNNPGRFFRRYARVLAEIRSDRRE
jgi:hypothetical protein